MTFYNISYNLRNSPKYVNMVNMVKLVMIEIQDVIVIVITPRYTKPCILIKI
jgi:hypothetical protein